MIQFVLCRHTSNVCRNNARHDYIMGVIAIIPYQMTTVSFNSRYIYPLPNFHCWCCCCMSTTASCCYTHHTCMPSSSGFTSSIEMLCTCMIGTVVLAWLSDYYIMNGSKYAKFIWSLLTPDQILHYVPGY